MSGSRGGAPTVRTHEGISERLCGTVLELQPGRARVRWVAVEECSADAHGLVHGGFVFGVADYAGMLAVNEPTVVLAKANVSFLKPVRVGDVVEAQAVAESSDGKKRTVAVEVSVAKQVVLRCELVAAVLDRHVLAPG